MGDDKVRAFLVRPAAHRAVEVDPPGRDHQLQTDGKRLSDRAL